MSAPLLLAAKELRELLGSARGLAWLLAMSIALSAFGLLLVGNSEIGLLDNARVVAMMMSIVTALGSVLAIVSGSDAIAGELERGTLTPLLLTPLGRPGILLGKLAGQVAAWLVMYAIALPYLWAVGSTGQNLVPAVGYLALLGTPVVLGFGFFAVGLSARFGSVRSSLTGAAIALFVMASPLMIPNPGASAVGQIFEAVVPLAAAFGGYDAAVIHSQSLDMQIEPIFVTFAWLGLTAWFARRSMAKMTP